MLALAAAAREVLQLKRKNLQAPIDLQAKFGCIAC
jgi:hypothetical protein